MTRTVQALNLITTTLGQWEALLADPRQLTPDDKELLRFDVGEMLKAARVLADWVYE